MGKWVDIMVRDREGTRSTSGTTEQQTREKQTALKLNLWSILPLLSNSFALTLERSAS